MAADEAAGPGSDDRDALLVTALGRLRRLVGPGVLVVGDEALQGADVERLVELGAVAGVLAPVVADAAADGREGVVELDRAQGRLVVALADVGDVALGPLAGRARVPARAHPGLLDGVGVGHRLGVELVGGALPHEPLVEAPVDLNGAHLLAVAAGRALGGVDVAGVPAEPDPEVPGLPFEGQDLRAGEDLDVEVPPHVHQLGADGAHRAVVGGEGLVQLGHVAADGGAASRPGRPCSRSPPGPGWPGSPRSLPPPPAPHRSARCRSPWLSLPPGVGLAYTRFEGTNAYSGVPAGSVARSGTVAQRSRYWHTTDWIMSLVKSVVMRSSASSTISIPSW